MNKLCIFLLLYCMLFNSCKINESDLHGVYEKYYTEGKDILILNDSNQYIRISIYKDTLIVSINKWEFISDNKDNFMSFLFSQNNIDLYEWKYIYREEKETIKYHNIQYKNGFLTSMCGPYVDYKFYNKKIKLYFDLDADLFYQKKY